MATDNFAVDYNDERFKQVENEKNAAINAAETTINGMIDSAEEFYKAQGENVKNYADTQQKLQQQKTDLEIEQIEQQKEKTERDYIKEQSAAYVDYKKQIDPHGVQAEQMAANGMLGSGYAESSKVSMYNTYQNRVASARESYQEAVLNYDNLIAEARLQNSTVLAEIAFNAQQEQLTLALEGFQYKNSLILGLFEQKQTIENTYYARQQDILNQINTENAMRQEQENWEKEYKIAQDENAAIIKDDSDDEDQILNVDTSPTSPMTNGSGLNDIMDEVYSIGSIEKMAEKLEKYVSSGKLSQAEADRMIDEYLAVLQNREWTMLTDGGTNGLGGIDRDAIIEDEYENQYTLAELLSELKKAGMSNKEARQYVKTLQEKLGID